MFKKIDFAEFETYFNRTGLGDQFSTEALRALFDYLEGIENDTHCPIQLDVAALCCEFEEKDPDDCGYEDEEVIRILPKSVLVRFIED